MSNNMDGCLKGQIDGVYVWRRTSPFRNMISNYMDRKKTSRGLVALTNQLFEKMYGDRVQALHLLDCYKK